MELAKVQLNNEDIAVQRATRRTLVHVLEAMLRLAHPIIPFITEEIWHSVAPKLKISGQSISMQSYPVASGLGLYPAEASDVAGLKATIIQIRSIRSQLNIPPSKLVPLLVEGDTHGYGVLGRHKEIIKLLTKLESIEPINGDVPASAMAVLDNMKLHIPMAGLIDLDAEKARLAKELKRIEIEIGKCRGKLASDTFVANAPPAVVEQERQRLLDWNAQQIALSEQLAKLG